MFNVPILFIIFNSHNTAQRVFNIIRKVQSKQFFVAADGPREGNDEDIKKCQSTREIINQVDWKCNLKTLFRKNLGSGLGVSNAISWFFENVEEGIILEHDCLPNQSFFRYCEELLKYYRNEDRIMHIGGQSLQFGKKLNKASYYFSAFTHIWGWATWKRAWNYYDFNMSSFPQFKNENKIKKIFNKEYIQNFWLNNLQEIYHRKIKTIWEYQWTYVLWNNGGISILPQKNLVKYIGFTETTIHTQKDEAGFSKIKVEAINKIIHPPIIEINKEADEYTYERLKPYCFVNRKI